MLKLSQALLIISRLKSVYSKQPMDYWDNAVLSFTGCVHASSGSFRNNETIGMKFVRQKLVLMN